MKESTASAAVIPAAIVEEAWQEVGASFERFCLTAGIATLANMMDEDAARLCGPRYGRAEGKAGHRWGKTKGKVGFHGGKVEIERPRVRARDGGEVALPSWETAMSEDLLTLLPDSGPAGSSVMRRQPWSCRPLPALVFGIPRSNGGVAGCRRPRCIRRAQPSPRAGFGTACDARVRS